MNQEDPPLSASTVSPTLPSFDDDGEDELSMTRAGHPAHFLLRTLRLSGDDLERAMRLYHHSDLLRRLVPELMAGQPEAQRAAIPTREGTSSPSVIVTRCGQFITCLDETMATDLPPLAYEALAAAMDKDDAARAQARLRARQLQSLPAETLSKALLTGFGHVTREMVHILQLDPTTYEFTVARVFLNSLQILDRVFHIVRYRRLLQNQARLYQRRDASMRLSMHLLGAIDTDLTDELLRNLLKHESGFEQEAVLALVRHRRGGEILASLAEELPPGRRNHEFAAIYAAMNGFYHPENGPANARRLLRFPEVQNRSTTYWTKMGEMLQALTERPDEEVVRLYRNSQVVRPVSPSTPYWKPTPDDLFDVLNRYFLLTSLFPPESAARAAQEAWARRVREAPPPPRMLSTVDQVRRGPTVGRNQPCPCGSGRKYKQCCLGAPPPSPAPTEP